MRANKKITFNSDVELTSPITISATSTSGDIEFTGKINSVDTTPNSLTLNGRNISFDREVGGDNRLGAFEITSTGDVKFQNLI